VYTPHTLYFGGTRSQYPSNTTVAEPLRLAVTSCTSASSDIKVPPLVWKHAHHHAGAQTLYQLCIFTDTPSHLTAGVHARSCRCPHARAAHAHASAAHAHEGATGAVLKGGGGAGGRGATRVRTQAARRRLPHLRAATTRLWFAVSIPQRVQKVHLGTTAQKGHRHAQRAHIRTQTLPASPRTPLRPGTCSRVCVRAHTNAPAAPGRTHAA
jgi:hypothetical protein